jgi:hypothetical protein
MSKGFFNLIGVIVFVGLIIYLATYWLKFQVKFVEGLTNPGNSSSSSTSGVAGGSTEYASNIKNVVTQMQDTLLVSKYRSDYENIIINLDDYLNSIMLQTVLSMDSTSSDPSTNLANIQLLNSLNDAKSSLNVVMKYIDST